MTTKKAPATFQCSECDHAPYADLRGLATHRRYAHGYVSTSREALSARKATAKRKKAGHTTVYERLAGEYPCPHCNFVAKWKGGLTHHIRAAHKPEQMTKPAKAAKETRLVKRSTQTIIATNGHQPASEAPVYAIPDALVALTTGRLQELCRSVAYEHDVPSRMFTARVAALFYASQVRQ